MAPLLPLPETLVLYAFVLGFVALVVRLGFSEIFRTRAWKLLFGTAALVALFGLTAWRFAPAHLANRGVELSWTVLLLLLPLALSLPIAAIMQAVLKRALARAADSGSSPNVGGPAIAKVSRRALLGAATLTVPTTAVSASAVGLRSANAPARLVPVRVEYQDLHPDLDGLRVLQLSDLHLGAGCFTSRDLEYALESARAARPDLIVFTGDVADRPEELRAGLAVAESYRPRLGVYSILGNHEYFPGIEQMLEVYANSDVPLLINSSVTLRVGCALLHLSGADDPHNKPHGRRYFDHAIPECARSAPTDAFRLLLCHRPSAFDRAVACGYHLMLAGHTHGSQIGIMGRSAVELLLGERYQWGLYRKGQSYLYTTSGFGHWFPFRLNCPTEMPLITLKRSA